MARFINRVARKLAPNLTASLSQLKNSGDVVGRLARENAELRAEVDELRQDSQRIAELYDLVFERLEQQRG